jgi:hypothetical protein
MANRQPFPVSPAAAAGVHVHGAPADSELPACEPAPHLDEVLPPPEDEVSGLENVAEELLPAAERARDELNHVGMDVELPGEDQAPLETDEVQREPPETWGRI